MGVPLRVLASFEKGDLRMTDRTDPDWEPILKLTSGVIAAGVPGDPVPQMLRPCDRNLRPGQG
ncbi:MAG: hypothetical protein NTU65_09015 [Cyanobacteria bacterium]|nr:hypothetical protein [Cyanobacteriota bacterium]